MNILNSLRKVREVEITPDQLIAFESKVKETYEAGEIKGVIHLAGNNENILIQLFSYIDKEDWVFSAWRNHYHAILHGIPEDILFQSIKDGKSMGTNSINPLFYSSSIVGGIIPIALGVAKALKLKNSTKKVWCFIGVFWEAYKYAKNFDLNLQFVIEDNNISVHTPTELAWGKKMEIPSDVIYYNYEMKYPHHGTGKWINF